MKVEAMYRNELLDDIINMYKTINNVKESLILMVQSKWLYYNDVYEYDKMFF